MVVLIDGYNIIRFLFPRESPSHESELLTVFSQLARYASSKKSDISEVIVVLDGGLFGHKTREIYKGISIVHAGRGRKADDVLVEYAQILRSGAVLISNDRELQRRVVTHACGVLGVQEFWNMVGAVCSTQRAPDAPSAGALVNFVKYSSDEDEDGEMHALDTLLIEGSKHNTVYKNDDDTGISRNKGNAVSKKEKVRRALHKKLG
jgi:predicted RNA-binding protein with PIN domain